MDVVKVDYQYLNSFESNRYLPDIIFATLLFLIINYLNFNPIQLYTRKHTFNVVYSLNQTSFYNIYHNFPKSLKIFLLFQIYIFSFAA